MKVKILYLLVIFLMISVSSWAQIKDFQKAPFKPRETVCPGLDKDLYCRIPATKELISRAKGVKKDKVFNVTYTGFTGTRGDSAKAAFQTAVDIWESIIISPVKINIQATWKVLGSNVLDSASPGTFYRSGQFPKLFTWYPIALAEKLAGKELNGSSEADIEASFSSNQTAWYLGTDGNPPTGKYDFVTVVLHELGHGLGFVDGMNYNNGVGTYLYDLPFAYDWFIENQTAQLLTNTTTFPNNSTQLGSALVKALYYNSPIMVAKNGSQRAQLYSPTTFSAGSSTSHLNTATYSGGANGLMVHALNPALSIHEPGLIMRYMFVDMGWVHTYIRPDTIKSTETPPANFTVKAKITADSTLDKNSIFLKYSLDSFKTTPVSVKMLATANPDEYSAVIPITQNNQTYAYSIEAKDALARTYYSPSEPAKYKNYFYFYVGTDNTPPKITPDAVLDIFDTEDTLFFRADVSDIFGINQAYIEYQLNNNATVNLPLKLNSSLGKYEAFKVFTNGEIKERDVIKYRFYAQDNSSAKNSIYNPTSNTNSIKVIGTGLKTPQITYTNDFNNATTATDDFFGIGFSINTPGGFVNGSLNSEHPYQNGSDANFQSNFTYQLKVPIIIQANNGGITFDEIVLVEPGEEGSVCCNDNFFDYVIVEGSKDKGKTWKALVTGYDSRANTSWLSTWNSADDGNQNSTATPTSSLYKSRYIDMRKTFATTDTVVVRFRLFADQLAHGWGWSVDNLQIQTLVTGLEDVLAENQIVKVFPNPTTDELKIETAFKNNVKEVEITVSNLLGKEVFKSVVTNEESKFSKALNIKHLAKGVYLLKIKVGQNELIKRIVRE